MWTRIDEYLVRVQGARIGVGDGRIRRQDGWCRRSEHNAARRNLLVLPLLTLSAAGVRDLLIRAVVLGALTAGHPVWCRCLPAEARQRRHHRGEEQRDQNTNPQEHSRHDLPV